jgi:pyruvate/2-oxoglutarate dehydrogenase complex dihydrolipoamide acyltransferase (E2) component
VTDIVFPTLSGEDPDAEGVVATWFVREGEQVAVDQLIAEVALDKVSVEMLAPVAGTVHLLVEEEEAVKQGALIARVD